jgi:hypothetical protein
VVEEIRRAGVEPHLAEPADTSALRGPKRRAKTGQGDAKPRRELLAAGRLPACYIPRRQVLEWRALLSSTRTRRDPTPTSRIVTTRARVPRR